MIIRAADLDPEGMTVDAPVRIAPLTSDADEPIHVADVRVQGRILPSTRGLLFRGRLTARAEMACSRCLEAFGLDVVREFDLRYVPAAPPGKDVKIPEEELDVEFLEPDGGLDLAQVVTEQIYLEIPMKPLCRPSCKGLCATCGANLNNGACGCANLIRRS